MSVPAIYETFHLMPASVSRQLSLVENAAESTIGLDKWLAIVQAVKELSEVEAEQVASNLENLVEQLTTYVKNLSTAGFSEQMFLVLTLKTVIALAAGLNERTEKASTVDISNAKSMLENLIRANLDFFFSNIVLSEDFQSSELENFEEQLNI